MKAATKIASMPNSFGLKRTLNKMLDEFWSQLHKTVQAQPVPHLSPKPKMSKCRVAGMCICCESGKEVGSMARQAKKVLIHFAAHSKVALDALLAGKLVLLMLGRSDEPGCHAGVAASSRDRPCQSPQCVWHHIGWYGRQP